MPTDPGSSGSGASGGRAGADYFPLHLGDRWFFDDGAGQAHSSRVTGTQPVSGGTAMVMKTTNSDGATTELYLKSGSGVVLVPAADADAVTAAVGPLQILRLPVVSGDHWVALDKTLAAVDDLDGDGRPETLTVHADVTVVGFETVTTPAGDYTQVAHVQTVLTQSAKLTGSGQTLTVTATSDDWYAPDVGPVRNVLVLTSGTQTSRAEGLVTAWRAGAARSESVAPTLSTRLPAADAVVGGCCAAISVSFSEAMDTSVDGASIWQLTGPDGKPVAGQLTWSADARTATFLPASALGSGTYRAVLGTGAQDRLGNALAAEANWQFTVDASGPAVTPVTPLANATEVPLDSKVVFTLDEDLDAASVNTSSVALSDLTAGSFVDAQVSLSGRTITVTPSAPLKTGDQYGVNVIGVRDRFGNASAASWTFYADPGRFARPSTLLSDGTPVTAAATGQLFNDGRASLLLATGYNGGATGDFKLLVYRIQADGSASSPQRYDTMAGYGAEVTSLLVADLDGHGHPAVVAGSSGLGVEIFRPQADGSLAVTQTLRTAASYVVRLADLDGDGRLDLIGRAFLDSSTLVWMQQADGSFGPPRSVPLEANGFGSLAVGDLNGDGRPDIVSVGTESYPGHQIGIAYQQADGSFTIQNFAPPTGDAVHGVAIGDVNGDGRADLVLGLQYAGAIGVMLQTPQGGLGTMSLLRTGPSVTRVAVADIDGDGRQDVVVSGWGGWPLAIHRQRADGSLGGPELFPVLTYGQDSPGLVAVGDVDGDGRVDIVYANVWLRQRAVPAAEPPPPTQSTAAPPKRLGLGLMKSAASRR